MYSGSGRGRTGSSATAAAKAKSTSKPKTPSRTLSSGPNTKISTARYDSIPTSGGFGSKTTGKTAFAIAYSNGTIPCRLQTGTAKMSLTWQQEFDDIDYGIILPLCLEGLCETTHPYLPVAKLSCRDLLQAECAQEKLAGLGSTVCQKLREALVASSKNPETFCACLDIIMQISSLMGEDLTPFMLPLLSPIASQLLKAGTRTPSTSSLRGADVDVKSKCNECLQYLDENGGPSAYPLIHKKIPTYVH